LSIAGPEQLVDKKLVDLGFVTTLREAKPVALLSNLTHTDFDQRVTFGDQISYPLDHVCIPADRSIKRSTLVVAIAPDGTGLKRLAVVPRLPIERELCFWGYEVTKVIFEYHEHGFITIQLLKNGLTKCSCLPMPNSENSRTILAGGVLYWTAALAIRSLRLRAS
jgi:hypothetical protein